MVEVQNIIGKTVQARFGMGQRTFIKPAKTIASKQGNGHVLVEATDGSVMGSAEMPASDTDIFLATSFCPLGSCGYTRERASKALGYRGIRLQ